MGAEDCLLYVAFSVLRLARILVKGIEVFDAEDGFGADGLKAGYLRGGEANGGAKAAEVENFSQMAQLKSSAV